MIRPECTGKDKRSVPLRPWLESAKPLVGLCALVTACSSSPSISARDAADANDTGGTLRGKNELERAVLRELPNLPSGKPRRFGNAQVIADAAYSAASGRTCRALAVQGAAPEGATRRLACTEGGSWFFVPDVFGAGESGGR